MPKNLTAAVLAQVASGNLRPAFFVEIAFATETVWAWQGLGKITPAGPATDPTSTFPYGQTFTGTGWLGHIDVVPQVAGVVAQNITMMLSGIPVALESDVINAVRQNSIATVWLALLDGNGGVIGDPPQLFQGHADVPSSKEGAETCSIAITVENPLIDLNRAPGGRYTDVDQQIRVPGDTGFFQVSLLQDYLLVWPSPVAASSNNVTPPSYLTITPGQSAPIALGVGQSQQLACIETRSNGTTRDVLADPARLGGPIYSSDPTIATVTPGGLITGVGQGMCIITKRYVEGMYLGTNSTKPSGCVTASVTVVVTGS